MTFTNDLKLETKFWDFCQEVSALLKINLAYQVPFFQNQAYSKLDFNNPEILENIKKNKGITENINLSNIGGYPFNPVYKTKDGEFRLNKLNCVGAPWTPFFSGYIFLIHSISFLSYSFNFCNYEGNSEAGKTLFDTFTNLVENSPNMENITLKDFIEIN